MKRKSKKLAYLLRHDKTYSFDKYGWRKVEDLIANHHFTMDELKDIVLNNDKHRFEFSGGMDFIRACQGHSIEVDVELLVSTPPLLLYHGTSANSLVSIQQHGIKRSKRLYVHLSETINDALQVGIRHGSPIVLQVDCRRMFNDGFTFYRSRNRVWLTEFVPSQYIGLV